MPWVFELRAVGLNELRAVGFSKPGKLLLRRGIRELLGALPRPLVVAAFIKRSDCLTTGSQVGSDYLTTSSKPQPFNPLTPTSTRQTPFPDEDSV